LARAIDRPGRVGLSANLLPNLLAHIFRNRHANGGSRDEAQNFGLDARVVPLRSWRRRARVELGDAQDRAFPRFGEQILPQPTDIILTVVDFREGDPEDMCKRSLRCVFPYSVLARPGTYATTGSSTDLILPSEMARFTARHVLLSRARLVGFESV